MAGSSLLQKGGERTSKLKKAPAQDPATPTDDLQAATAAAAAAETTTVPPQREAAAAAPEETPAAPAVKPEPEEAAVAEASPVVTTEPEQEAAPAEKRSPIAEVVDKPAAAPVGKSLAPSAGSERPAKAAAPTSTAAQAPARRDGAARPASSGARSQASRSQASRPPRRTDPKGFSVYLSDSAINAIGVYRDLKAAEEDLGDGGYHTGFVVVDALNWWVSLGNVDHDSPAESPEPDLHEFCLRAVSAGVTISDPGAMFAKVVKETGRKPWQFTPTPGVLSAVEGAIAKFKRTEEYATSPNRRQLKRSPVIAELLVEFLSSTGLL